MKMMLPSAAQRILLAVFTAVSYWQQNANACTDVLVTPGASEDGCPMIAYNADSGSLMGFLYHYPATNEQNENSIDEDNVTEQKMRNVYEWDTGKYLGKISEATTRTYNVVGNVNEVGLCIGESTFGGVEVLSSQNHAIMDYGSLIYITLQRSKTAKEAIKIMVDLMDTYGYASEGESFSIADRTGEVWIMEVISCGSTYKNGRLGAVWVARRIPDGYVSAHANQARITTFPRNDPDNCIYAEDVVAVARHYGLYDDPDDNNFSFSDVYNPVTFSSARLSDARVWSIFSAIADMDGSFQQAYVDYATGRNLTNRMPLWVKPYSKLSLLDVMDVMSNHYEETELDSSGDVGSGFYSLPYRPRPLMWDSNAGGGSGGDDDGNDDGNDTTENKKKYHNERSVGTQQTGWNFIAQIRPWMPPELSALVWFAVDDSSTSPRFPVYGGSTRISKAYAGKGTQDGVAAPLLTFDLSKAFWVQNMVSNFAYYRWKDVYPIIRQEITQIQNDFIEKVSKIDKEALHRYETEGTMNAVEFVTDFGVSAGDTLHTRWLQFYGELFVRFRDFFTIVPNEGEASCGCTVQEAGFPDAWKNRIVKETGHKYEVDRKQEEQASIVDGTLTPGLRATQL